MLLALYSVAPLALLTVGTVGDTQASNVFENLVGWGSILISAGLGFLIGLGGLVALFELQLRLNWLCATASTAVPQILETLLFGTVLATGVSLIEELVFRSFLVAQLSTTFSLGISAVISSAIFALLHLVWDWRNTQPQLVGLWVMGMVLTWAYVLDGFSIGLPWGLHGGWILGMALMESYRAPAPTGDAPVWVTGPLGQPLSGFSALAFLAGTAGLLWLATG